MTERYEYSSPISIGVEDIGHYTHTPRLCPRSRKVSRSARSLAQRKISGFTVARLIRQPPGERQSYPLPSARARPRLDPRCSPVPFCPPVLRPPSCVLWYGPPSPPPHLSDSPHLRLCRSSPTTDYGLPDAGFSLSLSPLSATIVTGEAPQKSCDEAVGGSATADGFDEVEMSGMAMRVRSRTKRDGTGQREVADPNGASLRLSTTLKPAFWAGNTGYQHGEPLRQRPFTADPSLPDVTHAL